MYVTCPPLVDFYGLSVLVSPLKADSPIHIILLCKTYLLHFNLFLIADKYRSMYLGRVSSSEGTWTMKAPVLCRSINPTVHGYG